MSSALPFFDAIVIGGGSGGLAAARRAAQRGAKVALVEMDSLGGTCVNRGCVPKKLMWSAAGMLIDARHRAHGFGLRGFSPDSTTFDWESNRAAREGYIDRLHGVYLRNLVNDGVTIIHGKARISPLTDSKATMRVHIDPVSAAHPSLAPSFFPSPKADSIIQPPANGFSIDVMPHLLPSHVWSGDRESTASTEDDRVPGRAACAILAAGGAPTPLSVPGGHHALDSDALFLVPDLLGPDASKARFAVIGAGYIGAEIASLLAAFSSPSSKDGSTASVSLVARSTVLSAFDAEMRQHLTSELRREGLNILPYTDIISVAARPRGSGSPSDDDKSDTLSADTDPIASRADAVSRFVSLRAKGTEYWLRVAPRKRPEGCDDCGPSGDGWIGPFDAIFSAIGRAPGPFVPGLQDFPLDRVGQESPSSSGWPAAAPSLPEELLKAAIAPNRGSVKVDVAWRTSYPGMFALGDVADRVDLTPVAIAAGRRLSDWVWGGIGEPVPTQTQGAAVKSVPVGIAWDAIPTVVFTHPPVGSVGLSESQAKRLHGDRVVTYKSKFVGMDFAFQGVAGDSLDEIRRAAADSSASDSKPKTFVKMVCVNQVAANSGRSDRPGTDRVVGVHIVGAGADEMTQGFAVAVTAGLSKEAFDRTIAIHPTASEEVVTIR